METISINRGEKTAITFTITDAAAALLGKRVTFAVATGANVPPLLKKASGLGASSADVTIASQTAAEIDCAVNIAAVDFAGLPDKSYKASLWVDSGVGDDQCVTDGGYLLLEITPTVPRA